MIIHHEYSNVFHNLFGRVVLIKKIELKFSFSQDIFLPHSPADNFALGQILQIGEGFLAETTLKEHLIKINGKDLEIGQIIAFRQKGDIIKIPLASEDECFLVKEEDIFGVYNASQNHLK